MIKKIKTIGILIAFSFFYTGCGNNSEVVKSGELSSSNSNDIEHENKSIVMKPNKQYTIRHGDKIVKNSDKAVVKIIHTLGSTDTTVMLIDGNASIIY